MSKHLIVVGTVIECERDEYFQVWERVVELEAMLKESLSKVGDKGWHDRVHAMLGTTKPPMRKLTGKVPRYQQEQGFDETGTPAGFSGHTCNSTCGTPCRISTQGEKA